MTSTFSGIAGSTVAGMKTASSRLMDTSIGRISCRIIDFTVDAGEPKEKLSGMDSLTVGNGILSPAMVMGIELPGITIGFSSMPSLKSKQEKSLTDRHEQLGGLGLYIRDLDSGDIDASRDAQAGQQGSGRGVKLTLTFPSRPKLMAGMGMSGTVKGPTSRFPVTVRRGFSASTTVVVGMLMGPMPPLRVK